jgi:hypothetical protein
MLEGEINEINLVERLVQMWREQFTGALRFENDGIIKILYFKGGDVLSASTNDRSDSIDEILMRAGKVSREHVKQALAKRKESETLGDALLNLGFITRKELTWARRVQAVGVIRSIAAWTVGSFTIVADYLPKRDEGTLFPLPQVMVELIVTEQDRSRFERALDGGAAVFAKAGDFDDVFRRLGLNEDAEAIAREIDGEKTAAEIATASGRDTFNVYKLLNALATLGILRQDGKAPATSELSIEDMSTAGVADAADVWNVPPSPSFELESIPEPPPRVSSAPAAVSKTRSAWDDEPAEATISMPPPAPAAPPAPMPSWGTTSTRDTTVVPIPPPVTAALDGDKEQWGFDDAQIETAQRASMLVPEKASMGASIPKGRRKAGGRFGLVIVLFAIFILAGGGYYGFLWYSKRQSTQTVELTPRTTTAPAPAPAPAPAMDTTATIVPVTETATAIIEPAATTTEAALPRVTTRAPLEVTTPEPAPTPRPAATESAARFEAMAREYLANPRGNFTVQIQILCDPGNLAMAVRAGGENVWFVPQAIGSRSCYRVFWGHYATREEAQAALASVPASLRDASSSVKPVPR